MRKGAARKHHVATSKQNLLAKPYGFCCDIKDNDPLLSPDQRVLMPPFLSSGRTNEGPDIKFRIHDDEFPSSTARGAQKGSQRGGQRGRNAGRRRSGNANERGGAQSRQRGGNANGEHNGHQSGRQRGGGNDYRGNASGERMVCQKCRGPLKWYLEDEIAVARETMINERIEKYNTEVDRNVQIAKRKAKSKKRPKKKRKQSNEVKENTQENEEKT